MGAAAQLSARQVERRHILRNATLPVVTAMACIGELIGGTMIIENIFAWPGVGHTRFPPFSIAIAQSSAFTLTMVTVFVLLANLAVDVLNAALDPRLRRHEGGEG
ncbi:ABC transporter permease subunit [Klebsiella pneumoniae]|nr:ABC transporter permease subunit [Klebsiella pneumoniae]